MRYLLPKLLVYLTRTGRYRPQITWSSESWVHNFFRLYELIFWRRFGIKAEMSTRIDASGYTRIHLHSWESVFAFIESQIRELLKFRIHLPVRIWIPQMQTACETKMYPSPFLFAIAFDAVSNYTVLTNTTFTIAHTVTGSNMLLITYVWQAGATDKFSSLTYAGSAYASLIYNNLNYDSTHRAFFGYKTAPATGNNNIVLTLTSSGDTSMASTSYSGCAQTGIPDSSNFDAGGAGSDSYTISTTVVASNCWLVAGSTGRDGTCTGITSGALRVTANPNLHDSNGTVGTGSQGLSLTGCGNRVESKIIVSIAPSVSPPPFSIQFDGSGGSETNMKSGVIVLP